ncbi:MAG: DAHL domain-containing protein [Phormidesmis sp.]
MSWTDLQPGWHSALFPSAFLQKIQKLPGWVSGYAVPTGVALLFLLFWVKSQSVNLAQHNQYVGALRQLQEQDARMNQSLLQLRLGLLNNYDSIVNKQARIQTLNQILATPPSFVGSNRQILRSQVQKNIQLWQEKNELVQQFNSRHSVLRNSLAYFPIAIADLANDANTPPAIATALNTLLQDILLLNLSPTAERISRIEQDIQQLTQQSNLAQIDLTSTLAHANIILEKRLETDELIEQSLALPTRRQGTTLAETYDMAYQRAVRSANFYRFGLYLLLTALVMAIAISTITKLRQAAIARQQSENTQQALFKAIPDLMLRMYRGSDVYEVVSSGRSIVLPDPYITTANLSDVLPNEVVQQRLAAVAQSLNTRTTQIYEQCLEREGETVWEEVRVVPCGKKDVLVMIRDIGDRKQAEANLQRATEEAQVANKAKSQFLSNMTHELRTPLNVILGFTQLMTRNGALEPQQQGYLDSINQSGEHLLSLINDVLEMSKIEAGKVTLNQNDFDLHGLLVGIHTMFQFKAHSKGLELYLEEADDLPQHIRTDESKLRQVLVNLVGNAVKFTQVGSICLRAWMDAENSENAKDSESEQTTERKTLLTLKFAVEDTGPGISAEDINVLFDPFVQAKNTQVTQHEGTGLGLPISRKFVEMMGGDIALSSQVGVGSQFCFSIRTKRVKGWQNAQLPANRAVIGLAPGQPSYRVLVVEDMAENRQILVDLLSPIGFELQEAQDGLEAVEICQRWQPHLVWMDLRMPVMDGYEATRQIKASQQPAPVIIALSGSVFKEEKNLATVAGCDDFVSKPFRTEVIFEKMTEYLGVQYTYREPVGSAIAAEQNGASAIRVTAEDLQVMSDSWIARVHQAATKVNGTDIACLLEELPPDQTTLKLYLNQLLENFSFEEIVSLTKPH